MPKPSYCCRVSPRRPWYHGKIDKQGRTLETFTNEVRQFAATEYGPPCSPADAFRRHSARRLPHG